MTNRVIYLTTANSLGPKLEPDLNGGMSHTAIQCVCFLEKQSAKCTTGAIGAACELIKSKAPKWPCPLQPPFAWGSPHLHVVWGAHQNLASLCPKHGSQPTYSTNEKPYKDVGSI